MGLFDAPQEFALKMIEKFGVVEDWYLRYKDVTIFPHDPTKPSIVKTVDIPIKIAIASWEINLINETTILSGDRKCYIAYSSELDEFIKPDNYIIKKQNEVEVMKYKIVTPTKRLAFKDMIVAYIVNIRT